MTKTLLHTCCAPCSITCVDTLRDDGIEPVGFWYNPNIHPFTEYRSRKNTLEEYTRSIGEELIIGGDYGLRPFVQAVCSDIDRRCSYCYRCRLENTAQYAAQNGFSSFTTTLLVSPYQNHELLVNTGKEVAALYGIAFLPYDFRPRFREGQQRARELGLYMQKYCGCIFSEEERYRKRKAVTP